MSMIGKTLGNFALEAQIGKGGMGEVYKAKDQKLGRDVAIKVLPEEFARDADRIARFQREAKLLASLNHPNIAAIHGLEESGGTHFLVLELIEGDTLADRIRGGPIPVEESLKLALQIAEALEAAHEKGVIHRDLKPANIKVTPDGKVKVLDFGLAKAYAGDPEDMNLSNSPTLSAAATLQGMILGTAAYMSPEQARGKSVDKRTDVWAFGCVLYEMLTGRPAFQGEDVSEVLASVIKADLSMDLLPANIHSKVQEVLFRCLQKDLKKRYPDIANPRYEIEQVLADPTGVFVQPITEVKQKAVLRQMIPWLAAAVILTAIIAGAVVWRLKPVPVPEPPKVVRFTYELPENQQLSNIAGPVFAVSPDGGKFVYCTSEGLYLRSIGELDAKLLTGTEEDPQFPFFSPDGEWVGYFSGSQLRKIAVTGGASVHLCEVEDPLGASWNADDTIVLGATGGIMQISASGGTPESLLKADSVRTGIPQLMPDGKSALFTNLTYQANRKVVVRSLGRGLYHELFAGEAARYLESGHIVYTSGNNLMAASFDPARSEITGGPIPIIEGVLDRLYAISDSGTLVYVPGTMDTTSPGRTLVWVDRNGNEESLAASPEDYGFPSISPDGTKIALGIATELETNIWIWEVTHKALDKLTFEGIYNTAPAWSPDGKRIAYFSYGRRSDEDIAGVYWKAADGTGRAELLASFSLLGTDFLPYCWSSDGKTLIGTESLEIQRNIDISMLATEGDRERKRLLQQDYMEGHPQISPDGRWMAYTSDESRRNEVYVCSFPDVDNGRWQVSANGGESPLWSPDGSELFYRSGDAVMAVSVKTEPTFSKEGNPIEIFRGRYVGSPRRGKAWDIHPDGKRFLMIKPPGISVSATEGPRKINVIVNWLEELKQNLPGKGSAK